MLEYWRRVGSSGCIVNFITSRYGEEGKKYIEGMNVLRRNMLKLCKTYNVIPKFLRFKLHKRSLRSASFYRPWQLTCLIKRFKR